MMLSLANSIALAASPLLSALPTASASVAARAALLGGSRMLLVHVISTFNNFKGSAVNSKPALCPFNDLKPLTYCPRQKQPAGCPPSAWCLDIKRFQGSSSSVQRAGPPNSGPLLSHVAAKPHEALPEVLEMSVADFLAQVEEIQEIKPDYSATSAFASRPTPGFQKLRSLLMKRKGFAKRLFLRQVNRRVVRLLARRLTIAIPVYGLYLASKLIRTDYARSLEEAEAGLPEASRAFHLCAGIDALDIVSQSCALTLTASTLLGLGLAAPGGLLLLADKVAIGCGLASCMTGVYGEVVANTRLFAEKAAPLPVQEPAAHRGAFPLTGAA